jgi:hypothetical protein
MSSDSSGRPPRRKKTRFTNQDDQTILQLIQQLGDQDWPAIAACFPGRSARSCRERWRFFLDANPSRMPWSQEEDDLLRAKVREHGHEWITIHLYFTGRTSVDVKNRYAALQRRERPKIKPARKQRRARIQLPPAPDQQGPSLDGPNMPIEQRLNGH